MSDANGTAGGSSRDRRCGALLFDVGNVLVEVDFMRVLRHWADRSGRPIEALRDRFSPDVAYEQHERGEIDAAAYFDSLRESLGLGLDDEAFTVGWNMIFVDEVPGIRGVLASAARHAPLYAFSNTNDMHYLEWSTRFSDLLEPFEEIFASSRIARRKPEREAYELVARRTSSADPTCTARIPASRAPTTFSWESSKNTISAIGTPMRRATSS